MLAWGSMSVSEIADELDAPQPLISYHLNRLRAAGLVMARQHGKWVYYSLNRRLVPKLEKLIAELAPDRIE